VELHHLRYFAAVAEELNFGRAAQRLHMSISAVSRGVKELEVELGKQLFTRNYHALELTPQGIALRERAQALLAEVDSIKRDFGTAPESLQNRLVIGSASTLPGSVMRLLLEKARGVWPGVRIETRDMHPADLIDAVRRREIDISVCSFPFTGRDGDSVIIATMQKFMVMAADDPLALRDEVSWSDLAGRDVVILSQGGRSQGPDTTAELRQRFGFTTRLEDNVAVIASNVIASHALSVIASPDRVPIARIFGGDEFHVRPLEGARSDIHLSWRLDSELREGFAALIVEVRASLGTTPLAL
jgi:DNA-binding transcriptional LysR family regulator